MSYAHRQLLTIVALYLLSFTSDAALNLIDESSSYNLLHHLDRGKSESTIASTQAQSDNAQLDELAFSPQISSYDLAFTLHNRTAERSWVIYANNVHIDYIKLYRKTNHGLVTIAEARKGIAEVGNLSSLVPALHLDIPAESELTLRLYVEFNNTYNTALPNKTSIEIASLHHFIGAKIWYDVFTLLYFSSILIFFLFYLLLYSRVRLPSYGYFLLYLLSQIGLSFYYLGYNYCFLPFLSTPAAVDFINRLFIALCYIGALLFIRHISSFKKNHPLIDTIYQRAIFLQSLFIPLALFHSRIIAFLQDMIGTLLSVFVVITTLYTYCRGRHKIGLYLTLSLAPLIIASIATNIFFYLPVNSYLFDLLPLEEAIFEIGVVLQVILQSLVLAYYIKNIHMDRAHAQTEISQYLDLIAEQEKRYQQDIVLLPKAALQAISESTNVPRFLQKAKQIIEDHISDKEFNVQSLACALHVSEPTLRRRMEQLAGHTPATFIRMCRLHTARELLGSGDYRTLSQIASAVGFNQTSHFSRLYRKTFKTPPTLEKLEPVA